MGNATHGFGGVETPEMCCMDIKCSEMLKCPKKSVYIDFQYLMCSKGSGIK